MLQNMYLNFFCRDKDFPFFIQYGRHNDPMFLHGHADFSELVIILGGSATHVVNGEEYPLQKGDVFIINDNTVHGYKHTNRFRICNIMFQPSFFLPMQNDLKELPGFHALFVLEPALTSQKGFQECLSLTEHDFNEINKIMIQLHQEYSTHSSGYKTMITSLFLQMVTKLSRLYEVTSKQEETDVLSLANPAAYMERHFREDIRIEKLSEMANMSTRHFRRIFHGIYGISPLKYITSLRIQHASTLLISTDMPVTEIAIQCGFSDANYFSSKFKEATGKSPVAFRKGT